jgi:hypothetical protein
MKFSKKFTFTLILGLAFVATGCYKDQGNYTYIDVNKFNIDSFPSFSVKQFDTLKYAPKISGTLEQANIDDTMRFKYRWTISSGSEEVIGTEKNLNALIKTSPGNYTLYFKMIDTKTGQVFVQRSGSLAIGSNTFEGWLVLSDVEGNAQLDMVNFFQGTMNITRDLLSQSPDLPKPLKGPRKIAFLATGLNNSIPPPYHAAKLSSADLQWIYLTTDQGGWKLRNDFMFTQGAWNNSKEMLSSSKDSANFKPLYHSGGESSISSNYVYMVDENGDIYERAPGSYYVVSINRVINEGPFKAAPFIGRAHSYSWTENGVLYDTDKKRFVRSYQGNGYCTTLPNPVSNVLFDFGNVGMDMVWMRSMDNLMMTFAVMKDSNKDYWLLVFDARTSVTQNAKMKITSPDIDKAKFFTVDKNSGVLFYATENKVYAITKDFPGTYHEVLNTGNRKISWMDEHPFSVGRRYYNGDLPDGTKNTTNLEPYIANWVGVATYDPANMAYGTGTLAFYYPKNYTTNNAAFVKKDEYTGFGKIVSVSYRERPQ